MKPFILLLATACATFAVTPFDIRLRQLNSTATGEIVHTLPYPATGTYCTVIYDIATKLPFAAAPWDSTITYDTISGSMGVDQAWLSANMMPRAEAEDAIDTINANVSAKQDSSALGSAAFQATSAFDASGAASSAQSSAASDATSKANAAQAASIQRSNHTGTQPWSTITGAPSFLTAEVDGSTTNELELPSQTGQSGKVLGTNGSAVSWVTPVGQTIANGVSKTLVTSATGQGGVILDASRNVMVNYSVSTSTTATIGGASAVTVYLEVASTNSATAGDWTTIASTSNGQTITLAVVLQSVQTNILNFGAVVEAGKYMRLRTAITGTGSANYLNGQETKL